MDESNGVFGLFVVCFLLVNRKKFMVVLQDKYDVEDVCCMVFLWFILRVWNVEVVEECFEFGL